MQSNGIQKAITIRDLAAMLDVSAATISRALNNDCTVAQKTRKKVFELAERVGYRTNQHAKLLRNGRSNILGCIVPRLDSYLISSILSGAERAARREDYSLVVMQSGDSGDQEADCADLLFNKHVDGLLVVSPRDAGHFQAYLKRNIPVVLLDGPGSGGGFIHLYVDHHRAGYEMTRHLLGLGCRRIVHLTMDPALERYRQRFEGYRQALEEAGIRLRDDYVIRGGGAVEDGIEATEAIWRWAERPDAILASGDHCAAGCLRALLKRGIRVPKEIAVAGFDNDPIGLTTDPQLTTMRYPGREFGESAVNQLVHLMHGAAAEKMVDTIVLRGGLIVRGSTDRVGF